MIAHTTQHGTPVYAWYPDLSVQFTGADATGPLRELEVQGTTFNPDAGQVVGLNHVDANMEAIAAVCTSCNEARLESVVRALYRDPRPQRWHH